MAAGVPLGIWAYRMPQAGTWILGAVGVLQTVPSLALLAFLIAALFAAVLPAWLSRFAEVDYANEQLTRHLLLGGGLITVANVLIQVEALRQRRANARAA